MSETTTPTIPTFSSPEQVARRYGVSYRLVLEHIRTGRLKARAMGKNGGKPYRIADHDAEEWDHGLIYTPDPKADPGGSTADEKPHRPRRSRSSKRDSGPSHSSVLADGLVRARRPVAV